MLLRRQAQEHWVRSGLENGGYRPETRLMIAGPLVMNAVYARSCACLRTGAAVLELGKRAPDIAGHGVTHILALPALLEEIMDSLPADFAARTPIAVGTVGGFLSAPLRGKAARLFRGHVVNRYGANEVTGICDDLDAGGVGVVSAGVDIRIQDEQGRELPQGQLGIIAVRTPGMVDGYLNDDEATAKSFRDGWFVSGDWGTLVSHRVLRLAGRHDDLLNIGGIKLPAATVEAQVRAIVGADCVAMAVNLDGGAITLGLALVDGGGLDRAALRAKVANELQLGATLGAKVIFLDRVPRMDNGKIDRVLLHRLFAMTPVENL